MRGFCHRTFSMAHSRGDMVATFTIVALWVRPYALSPIAMRCLERGFGTQGGIVVQASRLHIWALCGRDGRTTKAVVGAASMPPSSNLEDFD